MYLSFIIPAFNEAARIEPSLVRAIEYFSGVDYRAEVLVVDDGSRDETTAIVERYEGEIVHLLRQPVNRGKGAAVRRGMLEARGLYRIFSDADFSTPVTETARVLEHLERYDVVVGSRALDSASIKEHQPWYREAMGKLFNLLVQTVAVRGIHDTQCGFKGFRAGAAEAIFSRAKIDGFSFDVEALFLARRLGFSIEEIPVEWYNDERSTLDPVTDSIRMLRELLRIRALHRDLNVNRDLRSVGRQGADA
jgi:dolichyl-phosphate beta-glucosyltransferase